jgi:hypothetical protein
VITSSAPQPQRLLHCNHIITGNRCFKWAKPGLTLPARLLGVPFRKGTPVRIVHVSVGALVGVAAFACLLRRVKFDPGSASGIVGSSALLSFTRVGVRQFRSAIGVTSLSPLGVFPDFLNIFWNMFTLLHLRQGLVRRWRYHLLGYQLVGLSTTSVISRRQRSRKEGHDKCRLP